jgi:hypothetical protein
MKSPFEGKIYFAGDTRWVKEKDALTIINSKSTLRKIERDRLYNEWLEMFDKALAYQQELTLLKKKLLKLSNSIKIEIL